MASCWAGGSFRRGQWNVEAPSRRPLGVLGDSKLLPRGQICWEMGLESEASRGATRTVRTPLPLLPQVRDRLPRGRPPFRGRLHLQRSKLNPGPTTWEAVSLSLLGCRLSRSHHAHVIRPARSTEATPRGDTREVEGSIWCGAVRGEAGHGSELRSRRLWGRRRGQPPTLWSVRTS